MRSHTISVLLVFLLALVAGCNGNGGSSTSPTPAPPPPAPPQPMEASIAVDVLGFGGIASGQGNLFGIGLRMTESAGVGVNINFIRLEVFRATGEFEERQEIGSGQIIVQTGSNRLEGNSTRTLDPVVFSFNATVKVGRVLRVTIGFTDDFGNNVNFVGDITVV